MAFELLTQCNLVYGFCKCALPEGTIDVDLQACTLKGIHTFRKDYKSQMTKDALGELSYSPTHP